MLGVLFSCVLSLYSRSSIKTLNKHWSHGWDQTGPTDALLTTLHCSYKALYLGFFYFPVSFQFTLKLILSFDSNLWTCYSFCLFTHLCDYYFLSFNLSWGLKVSMSSTILAPGIPCMNANPPCECEFPVWMWMC